MTEQEYEVIQKKMEAQRKALREQPRPSLEKVYAQMAAAGRFPTPSNAKQEPEKTEQK